MGIRFGFVGMMCLILWVLLLLAVTPAVAFTSEQGKPSRIVYADDHAYPPHSMLDSGGRSTGFNVELIRAICRELSIGVEVRSMPWKQVRSALETEHTVDVSAMYYSAERDRSVDFAVPFATVIHEIYLRRNSPPVASLDDLNGKQVLVEVGSLASEFIQAHYPGIHLVTVGSELEALRLLSSGTSDAAITPQTIGFYQIAREGLKNIVPADLPVLPTTYSFVSRNGRPELINELNRGMARVRRSGEYAELYNKWFGYHPPGLSTGIPWHYVALGGTAAFLLTCGILAWTWTLRRQVAERTQRLEAELAERRRIEQDIQAAREMAEQASRAKDHFLAVLSHELRTPLTPVLVAVTEALSTHLPVELRPVFEMIQRNVELEARLIEDLLDLTRLVRGKMNLHFRPSDAHELVQQAVAICMPSLAGKQQDVRFELNAVHPYVNGDPARLQQVFWNLLQNAIKFSPVGGEIVFRSSNTEEGRLMIQCLDRGVGLESDVLGRIFRPFEQVESSVSRQYGGLGLGLAISRMIIEAHHGSISADSLGPGKGAVFTLTLPRIVGPMPAAMEPEREAQPRQVERLRILLVEDSEDTRRVLSKLLRAKGHDVETAENVAAAKQIWHQKKFDLLLSDIGLPDATGLELAEELRSAGPLRAIAFSGFGSEEDIRKSKDAGFIEHLVKPLDIDQLKQALTRVMSTSPVRGH